jgi:hypothetical protein
MTDAILFSYLYHPDACPQADFHGWAHFYSTGNTGAKRLSSTSTLDRPISLYRGLSASVLFLPKYQAGQLGSQTRGGLSSWCGDMAGLRLNISVYASLKPLT